MFRRSSLVRWPCRALALTSLVWLLGIAPALAAEGHGESLGAQLHVASVAPFALLLLCIAVLPLAASHWWEHNRNKAIVAAILSAPMAVYLLSFGDVGGHALQHTAQEYLSFMLLLGSLFVISGGVYVQGSLSGTPLLNTGIMAFGAVLANFVGTTGASMLLIRPMLRANAPRQKKVHIVVFFIFVVSNAGGLLTPLGDPPLFLGFLRGVPFTWTFQLWLEWLLVNGLLLVVFNIWDQTVLNREERERPGSQLEQVMRHEPLRIRGLHNFIFLGGIVATIYASGSGLGNNGQVWPYGWAQAVVALLAILAYATTSAANRADNKFGFGPIIEVAVLFAGIFITMTPAVELLEVNGQKLGVTEPWQFYWASGMLSSFLDNAPTYVTFAAAAAGLKGVGGQSLQALIDAPGGAALLAAISCGSVMMGANTYIGNGPNFMVKAIAEENGVKMPSFFGYMAYSVGILIPIFVVVTLVFFR